MTSKYEPLKRYLESVDFSHWTTSFAEIERALGFDLPTSARTYHAWWANDRTHGHALAWMHAGWEATDLDLNGERITFRRVKRAGRGG